MQCGHFAAAHLVQDFSGLSVRRRIVDLGLVEREPPQHAARNRRVEPQHLQRGDQPVAAERGRIPGNPGIWITSLRRFGDEHAQVSHRPAQYFIENMVRRFNRCPIPPALPALPVNGPQSVPERRGPFLVRLIAADRNEYQRTRPGGEVESIMG